jgi:hypothetical protein
MNTTTSPTAFPSTAHPEVSPARELRRQVRAGRVFCGLIERNVPGRILRLCLRHGC